ncbi:DUF7289 family protein [Natranaeroarchaeum aerophilus]|uniref:Type IV pilin n=1 Tax=Natranaeroarchaeum aerophilus TaxID=2917711 RepID=A0AAE3K569_9EURY|nr:hypothetical protein [Natranaeroarchaeum aerophilus]MCL9813853.1 hypothetical protein [Natranaeroarchaeum aerophilus]
MSNDRGVAHVLGVILLAGFTITVAATVAVAGAAMFSDSQSQIETSQVESSFSSLAADASELEDNESVSFDLGTADGQLEVRENTGNLTIYHDSDVIRPVYGNPEEGIAPEDLERENIEPISVNSLVYTGENGDTVAYQAGGVFQQRGSGSSLVSAPDFYYRDNALSFPIQKVDGDISSSGTLSGELELQHEARHYPVHDNDDKSNPLSGGTVYVEMESEYCQAWEDYFDSQTRGSISEGCADDKDDNDDFDTVEGQVQVELSVPFSLEAGTFSEGVIAGNITNENQANFDYEEGEFEGPSSDSLIDTMESECENIEENLNEDLEESGLHCFENIVGSHEFKTDEADGDIEVYVNGTVTPGDGGLPVSGDSGNVTFYIQDGLDLTGDIKNGDVVGNEDSPEQTRIFISSSGYVFSDGGNIRGGVSALVYAPDSDGYIQSSGNSKFNGSIIVDDLEVQSNMHEDDVTLSEDAPEVSLDYEGAGPEFYYLHVTERTITASD